MSRPFPAGVDSGVPHYAAASEVARYVGEPLAVVVARDRYVAEDAPSSSRSTTSRSSRCSTRSRRPRRRGASPTAASPTATVDEAFARAPTSSSPERFSLPALDAARRSSATASSRDWDDAAASLTAWTNFQGPFTLHAVAARGARAARARSCGCSPRRTRRLVRRSRPSVYAYVVLIGLAVAPARRARDVDRGPARASRRAARSRPGASTEVEAAFARGRRAARAPLRRGRGRRRVRPRARAGDALPHARLALRRLPRAATSPRATAIVLTNRMPIGPEPRLRRAAALLRRSSGRWRSPPGGSGSTPPSSRAATSSRPTRCPYRTPSRRPLRLRRLRGLPRRRAASSRATRSSARERAAARAEGGSSGSGSPASSSRRSRTWATSRSPRPPTSARRGLPKSGNAEGATVSISPLGGITVRLATTPQGQGHRTVVRAGRRGRARRRPRATSTVLTEVDTVDERLDGRLGQLLVALLRRRRGAVQAAAAKVAAKLRRIAAHELGCSPEESSSPAARRTGRSRCAGSPAPRTGTPTACRPGDGAGPPRERVLRGAEPRAARRGRPGRLLGGARLHRRRRASSRSTARPARSRCSTTSPSTTRAGSSTRCSPTGQILGGFAHGAGAALFERHVYDEDGNLHDRLVHGLPCADRARPAAAHDRPPRVAVAVHRARREGARRGEHDERARRRSRTPSPTRSASTTSSCRSPRRASGSSSARAGA